MFKSTIFWPVVRITRASRPEAESSTAAPPRAHSVFLSLAGLAGLVPGISRLAQNSPSASVIKCNRATEPGEQTRPGGAGKSAQPLRDLQWKGNKMDGKMQNTQERQKRCRHTKVSGPWGQPHLILATTLRGRLRQTLIPFHRGELKLSCVSRPQVTHPDR